MGYVAAIGRGETKTLQSSPNMAGHSQNGGSMSTKQEAIKTSIIDSLRMTKREGIEALITDITDKGFFEAPASTRFHGCYQGGLAAHSHQVYALLYNYNITLNLEIPQESLIIAALLHDVCKIGAYMGNAKPYAWNKQQPAGHAKLSLERIKKFIKLTELEEKMILYHMGVYGLVEFQDPGSEHRGEYNLRNEGMANAWYHHPIVKVMYFCDEIATLQEKIQEK
jgi:23S rRNA maturation-related 3'-5' exoribonuclease YhaM